MNHLKTLKILPRYFTSNIKINEDNCHMWIGKHKMRGTPVTEEIGLWGRMFIERLLFPAQLKHTDGVTHMCGYVACMNPEHMCRHVNAHPVGSRTHKLNCRRITFENPDEGNYNIPITQGEKLPVNKPDGKRIHRVTTPLGEFSSYKKAAEAHDVSAQWVRNKVSQDNKEYKVRYTHYKR